MNNFNQNWNNQQQPAQNQNQQTANSQNQQAQSHQTSNQPSKMMQMVGAVLPVLIEQFTGQKMATGGTSAETQLILSQVLSIQQQILTTQQALNQRLVQLEQNATNQFTNLTNQVQSIKSVRLTHEKEKKQIDYNLQSENEENN